MKKKKMLFFNITMCKINHRFVSTRKSSLTRSKVDTSGSCGRRSFCGRRRFAGAEFGGRRRSACNDFGGHNRGRLLLDDLQISRLTTTFGSRRQQRLCC